MPRPAPVADALEPRRLFAFGITTVGNAYVVDSGVGLTFSIDKSSAEMTSIKLRGTELMAPYSKTQRYSHLDSGLSTATVTAEVGGSSWAKVKAVSGAVTQSFVVRNGYNDILMATDNGAVVGERRWITYLDKSIFTNHSMPADISGGQHVIEGADVYATDAGVTHSKFYSSRGFVDFTTDGITGNGFGAWITTPNREHSSGGPFFRDIQQQTTDNAVELYDYMFSGHEQTEAMRTGLNTYALRFNTGNAPGGVDLDFLANCHVDHFVPTSGRGSVTGTISGNTNGQPVTVGLSNAGQQYWAKASGTTFTIGNVLPGTYTQTLYMGELAVATKTVTVAAARQTVTSNMASTWVPPANRVFAIGTWDGTPGGFKNATNMLTMHPSDVRMAPWTPTTYTVGTSSTASFPALQWKTGVNSPTKVAFTLASAPTSGTYTLRIGLTAAFAGGRPIVTANPGQSYQWTSPIPAASSQPNSRSITRGTYRGNNVTFTYSIPASALRRGTNVLSLDVASGSSGTTYLSPGWAYDALDLSAPATTALTAATTLAVSSTVATATPTRATTLVLSDARDDVLI